MRSTEVTVVGGGITGMAAAWELVNGGAGVTLVEASDRLGGKILTDQVAGRPVDLGPDAFLARLPDAIDLCQELGIGDELVGATTESASLWIGNRLRPLPRGTVLGAPCGLAGLGAAARSGVLSPSGVLRAGLDLVLPRRDLGEDPSVGEVVTARFGRQVHERLVDPLVGGIHAGPSALLSAEAVAPSLAAGARSRRSLLLGLQEGRRAATAAASPPPGPAFASLRSGMGRLVSRLEDALRESGVHIQLGCALEEIPASTTSVILTTPAPMTAVLLADRSPDAAAELVQVEHASVALTVLRYRTEAFPDGRAPAGSGFLVPRSEGRLMTACSFASVKWPHWASPDEIVLRVSAGRWRDERALVLDDAELVALLHEELVEALGVNDEPSASRVIRWPRAFPQYRPGHLARVSRIEAALRRDCPRVQVAGATFCGVGIPACIAQGRAAARRALGL